MNKTKGELKELLDNGTAKDKRELFSFDKNNTVTEIYGKYILFTRNCYPRYFRSKSAPFHKEMIMNEIKSYLGHQNYLNIAFRGSSKTTGKKLFLPFALLNDLNKSRKYLKVLTRDLKNSKQVVTDVFNLILEVQPIYGNIFEESTDIKREKTMSSFTTKDGVKLTAGTVGQTQRGHLQDAYRPDWIWFDDIEDSESIQSDVITNSIIMRVDEAVQGLAFNGNWSCTGNWISDLGVISNLMRKDAETQITPIIDDQGEPTWDRYTKEKIASLKANAEDWFGEFMCDPVSGANREFSAELFNYVSYADVQKLDTLCYITIDPAVSKKDSADYTGFTINWVSSENKWYFKSWREKLDSAELFDKLFELHRQYKPEKIGIEETAFTQALEPFLEEEMRKRNIYLNIIPLKHGGVKKEVRIRGLLPRYTSNSIFHIQGETQDLEGELLRFPISKNDDTMDSAAYQVQVAESPHTKSYVDDPSLLPDVDELMYSDIGM